MTYDDILTAISHLCSTHEHGCTLSDIQRYFLWGKGGPFSKGSDIKNIRFYLDFLVSGGEVLQSTHDGRPVYSPNEDDSATKRRREHQKNLEEFH